MMEKLKFVKIGRIRIIYKNTKKQSTIIIFRECNVFLFSFHIFFFFFQLHFNAKIKINRFYILNVKCTTQKKIEENSLVKI